MRPEARYALPAHDPADPNPWLALYLDNSVPLHEYVKAGWLMNLVSRSRQFLPTW